MRQIISFMVDDDVRAAIEAERERISEELPGTTVTRSTAIRTLIMRGGTANPGVPPRKRAPSRRRMN